MGAMFMKGNTSHIDNRKNRWLQLIICITVSLSFYTYIRFKIINRLNGNNVETFTRRTNTGITHAEENITDYQFPQFLRINGKVNCRKIIEGDEKEIAKANKYVKFNQPKRITEEEYIAKTNDCYNFFNSFGYDAYPVTEEEREFPLAFSLLTFKDVDQTERLLRSIYRPQNFYCIHIDDKSSSEVLHNALRKIANCLSNVFIVSKTEDVIYSHVSRLRADINCMTDLLSKSNKWKYFINLPHQQFPLKTNLEIVKILKIYNGANDIEGTTTRHLLPDRFKYSYKYINNTLRRTGLKKGKLPYNANIVKGSAYGIFSREFVQYVVYDEKAKAVFRYMEDFLSPDEYFWATLNHNEVLKAPGRFTGNPDKKSWLAVYVSWSPTVRCHGKFVRGVCIFGVGDLNKLASRKELFANKFYADFQYLAMDCLEEYIHNKTFSPLPFDSFYYRQLPFIRKS